jgi:polysaccharide export outer membrane protein
MYNFCAVLKNLLVATTFVVFLLVMLSSCGNSRQLVYMQGQFDTTKLSQVRKTDPVIQKGDLVSIVVYSDNAQATALFNQPLINVNSAGTSGGTNTNGGGGTGSTSGAIQSGASPTSPGYLVDEDGNIQFQKLGVLHVEGLTRTGLKDLLDSKLKDTFLINPYYTIRFLNYKFTMLGEVMRPGIFNIPGEHISLLEALGVAGDITFYGRRDNVLVIREVNGKRDFQRLDLTKPDIMASPYFYLQQGDVVYVEPNKRKVAASDQVTARNISIALSIVSTIAIIYSLLK